MKNTVCEIGNLTIVQDHALTRLWIKSIKLDWLVVKAEHRKEVEAYQALIEADILSYFPVVPRVRRVRSCKQRIDASVPMFLGYLFVGLPAAGGPDLQRVLNCRYVEYVLRSRQGHKYAQVSQSEMLRIVDTSCAIRTGQSASEGHVFSAGSNVSISTGAGNLSGVVREIKADGQAKVDIQVFGRETRATVAVDKLVKC